MIRLCNFFVFHSYISSITEGYWEKRHVHMFHTHVHVMYRNGHSVAWPRSSGVQFRVQCLVAGNLRQSQRRRCCLKASNVKFQVSNSGQRNPHRNGTSAKCQVSKRQSLVLGTGDFLVIFSIYQHPSMPRFFHSSMHKHHEAATTPCGFDTFTCDKFLNSNESCFKGVSGQPRSSK